MGLDIKLHPKQIMALTTPANEILYGGAVGGGKALALDTDILTSEGWKTMKTVAVGDTVYDENGEPCKVLAKSKPELSSDVYEIKFNRLKSEVSVRDNTVYADGKHEWTVASRVTRWNDYEVPRILTTEEMSHRVFASEERANYKTCVAKPVKMGEKPLPIHPYVLGAYLCDGVVDIPQYSKLSLRNRLKSSPYGNLLYLDGGKYSDRTTFYSLIHDLGLDAERKDFYIPNIYKFNTIENRILLLQGMFDAQGTFSIKGKTLELYTVGQQLAEDVVDILATLGEKVRGPYSRFRGDESPYSYRVRFSPKRKYYTVRSLALRLDKYYKSKEKLNRTGRIEFHYFSQIEKIKEHKWVQCIQVDSPTNTYLATKMLIPTHNSFLMRVAAILWAMECPGIQIYLFRLTRKELDDNHMVGSGGFYDLLADAVNSKFVKINGSKHEIQFKNGKHNSYINGSIIHLCHCQHEDDKYLYQGAEMAVLMIDEATHFTWSKYSYLRTRVRNPETWSPPKSFTDKWGENFFPRILLGSNPGGISHAQFRKEFVKIASPGTIVQMPKERGGMRRQFIPAKLDDNPSLDKAEYEGKVMAVGDAETARMLLEGDWDVIAGGMFDDVWDESIHMIEPFEIPEDWYVDRSCDWGYTDPFSIGWWAMSDGSEITLSDGSKTTFPKGTLFRIAEWYGWTGEENVGLGLTAYEIGEGIKRIEKTDPVFKNIRKVYPGPADTQMWNASPKQDSVYRALIHEMNSAYYGSDSYMMFDIFTKADKSSGSRVRGWNVLRTHLKNSLKFPMIDKECIYFFKTCPTPARIIPTTIRHDKKREDIADGQEDHVLDEIRYRVQHTRQRTRRVPTRMG